MQLPRWGAIASFFLAAILCAPAWGDTTGANAAVPGTLNYVEGQVSIGDQALNSKSIGSAQLQPGQSLTTETGKAEILLTPGVFLRVGDNSSVEMISPSLTKTEVGVNRGHAMIEVAEIYKANDIRVTANGATARLLKTGLYGVDLRQNQFRVYDGKASVYDDGRDVTVKGGRELGLAGNGPLKARKFDKKDYEESDLYRWSSLRSAYLAEANVNAASIYVDNGFGPWGPGWWGAGWYWDPWFSAYTFIPGDGIFYSPFGWGFYSPWLVYDAPFYGFYGYGGYGPLHYHHFSTNYRDWGAGPHYIGRDYAHGIYHGPGAVRGFHSGSRMSPSPGFRGFGGGEFHGGGFHGEGGGGGGFHGGGVRG